MDKPLTVATYAYTGIDRKAAITPLGKILGHELNKSVEIKVYKSPSDLIEAVENNRVDIAVPNLFGFLDAKKRNLDAKPIAVPDVPLEKASRYRSVLVVSSKSFIKSELDLRENADKMRAVLVWADSTSGGIVPMGRLREIGIDDPMEQFKSFDFAGSHEKSLNALITGKADLAGLAGGVLEKSIGVAPKIRDQIKVIWSSPPIPIGPILCVNSETVSCHSVSDILLDVHNKDLQVLRALNTGWPEYGNATTLIPPDPKVYAPLMIQSEF